MRILFALPGLHRYSRGAETAFISLAAELAKGGDEVTLIGSGLPGGNSPYRFFHCNSVPRDKFVSFPHVPPFRNEYAYEELTFATGLLRRYRPAEYDVTITCSYPFVNWVLRRPVVFGKRPAHVFVTENGDWPAYAQNSEYRLFNCEGLVCTNPDFYARNKDRWRARLIPNGIDCERFTAGQPTRSQFRISEGLPVILMVSALTPNKQVELGIRAVSQLGGAHLIVAGDGPLREVVDALAAELLPGRFTRLSVAADEMPDIYRSAHVFLHLSKEESFGNVFLEAMASGLPIVAYDSSRVRWIVGNDEFFLKSDDASDIAGRLDAAKTSGSEQRRARMLRANTFSWPLIAAQYRTFLHEVAAA
jgi:glycosyltransferase involved in cell wall biosynthesis